MPKASFLSAYDHRVIVLSKLPNLNNLQPNLCHQSPPMSLPALLRIKHSFHSQTESDRILDARRTGFWLVIWHCFLIDDKTAIGSHSREVRFEDLDACCIVVVVHNMTETVDPSI